jgi:hypothetical protein
MRSPAPAAALGSSPPGKDIEVVKRVAQSKAVAGASDPIHAQQASAPPQDSMYAAAKLYEVEASHVGKYNERRAYRYSARTWATRSWCQYTAPPKVRPASTDPRPGESHKIAEGGVQRAYRSELKSSPLGMVREQPIQCLTDGRLQIQLGMQQKYLWTNT